MALGFLPHPCTRRVRAESVPDSERELKPLKNSLKIHSTRISKPLMLKHIKYGGGSRNRTGLLHYSDRNLLKFKA